MKEAEFATQFEGTKRTMGLFQLGGWRWCHFRPGRVMRGGVETYETPITGDRGLPDYIAVQAERQETVFIEIKGDTGRLTASEKDWIADLRAAGQRVYIWWPKDFEEAKEVLL